MEQVKFRFVPDPIAVEMEAHSYWTFSADEIGRDFEVRHFLDTGGAESEVGPPQRFTVGNARTRVRTRGIYLPKVAGHHHLRVQWRARPEDGWKLTENAWPLQIEELLPPPGDTQA
ncbi:MAG: hypothetical protein IT370_00245 [Deltaproteobacteria bacterium]|nr:hypothetical protein [Deltaproteobacteria bacterium]